MDVGNLLVEWRGPPVSQRARMPARYGWIPSADVRRDGGVGLTTTRRKKFGRNGVHTAIYVLGYGTE